MNLAPSIAELERSRHTMRTNAPINEKEGNMEQAKLERENDASFKSAIRVLKQWPSRSVFKKK